MNKDGIIYTIIFSFIVTFLFVILLAFANIGTEDIVAENQKLAGYRAILSAMGVENAGAQKAEVFELYNDVEEFSSDEQLYYRTTVDGETVYGLQTNGPGLWGNIEVVVGFDSNVDKYLGLEIIDQNETPGLGGRITEDWFKNQFKGQQIPEDVVNGSGMLNFVAGDGAGDSNMNDSSVDAITGASRTTEGMQAIVSKAAVTMKSILGGM